MTIDPNLRNELFEALRRQAWDTLWLDVGFFVAAVLVAVVWNTRIVPAWRWLRRARGK